jgi:hypothetical protein
MQFLSEILKIKYDLGYLIEFQPTHSQPTSPRPILILPSTLFFLFFTRPNRTQQKVYILCILCDIADSVLCLVRYVMVSRPIRWICWAWAVAISLLEKCLAKRISVWLANLISISRVWSDYRRDLNGWPDLLDSYTTRYYTSQITIGHTRPPRSVTVFISRCLVAAFKGGLSSSSAFSNCSRTQLPDSHRNS